MVTIFVCLKSLWPADAVWWHRSGSTLVQVMACNLTAASHFRNQCWLIINDACYRLAEGNFTETVPDITLYKVCKNYIFENTATSPRGQWVDLMERLIVTIYHISNGHQGMSWHKLITYTNSLWPSDVIWRQGSRSTMARVMACCLMAPSHYLNQCWLMISEVLWYSPVSNFTENT